MDWSVFAKRPMSSQLVVVGSILRQDPAQVRFAQDNHMVNALASDRTDQPFDEAILPRRDGVLDTHRASEQTISSLGSRLTDAGQQPPHNLPVRIAAGRDSLHRLLSEGLGLLFGLSLVFRKRHPLADDFSARLVFWFHGQNPFGLKLVDGSIEAGTMTNKGR
jgi:hypothetical protein